MKRIFHWCTWSRYCSKCGTFLFAFGSNANSQAICVCDASLGWLAAKVLNQTAWVRCKCHEYGNTMCHVQALKFRSEFCCSTCCAEIATNATCHRGSLGSKMFRDLKTDWPATYSLTICWIVIAVGADTWIVSKITLKQSLLRQGEWVPRTSWQEGQKVEIELLLTLHR